MSTLLWFALALLIIVLATALVLSFYMTKRQPLTLLRTPSEFGLPYEEVGFPAADGVALRGWWIPAPGSLRAVLIMHGHGGSMDHDVHRAVYFHEAGLNVLLFDFRAHGRSQGRQATFGYLERRDVQGALAFLKSRGMQRIGVLGFSYGGIAAVLGAPICPEIAAVIVDGCPARMRSAMAGRGLEAHLPRWFSAGMAWLLISLTSLRLGVSLFQFEPLRWVRAIAPRPILFIHGEQDQYCPDFDELFAAAGEPKEVWRLPNVGHTKPGEVYPEEHRRRITAFFLRHL
jgi:fermentation-respiration switch protein FrsA (DUF1100 family)